MTQPKEIYRTNAIICTVGRAIAIDLNQCQLPGNAKNKHMTIMFRKSPKWSLDEIELISKETDNWIKQKYGSAQTSVTFNIENWGKKSVKILGDLYDLCLHLRKTFNSMTNDAQRIPHIELFTNSRHKNKDKKHQKKDQNCGVNNDKFRIKLEKMIIKMQELKLKKEKEILLLDEEEKELKKLLNNSDNLDIKTLKNEIKNIAKSFKIKKKEMRLKKKDKGKKGRDKKRGKKREKKKEKLEKLEKLSLARLNNLPLFASDIGNKSILNIYIDGYNIIGCDSICRKLMRGKYGGIKKSRLRLIKLLQENFINKINNKQLLFNYNINNINLYFDGNGKNNQYKNIKIIFSSKKQIVDDKLIELFNNNKKEENINNLVITSDKELTLRLYKIGVKVMKSSIFYKKYLKEQQQQEIEDDIKEEDNAPDIIIDEDDFVQIIAKKLNYNDNNNNKIGEDTPDDEDYSDDIEFTSIFGEDIDFNNSD